MVLLAMRSIVRRRGMSAPPQHEDRYSAGCGRPAPTPVPLSSNGVSGCIRKAQNAPSTSSPIDMMKGKYQLPVTSITYPATSGETIAAKAEPVFIRPEAVPEYFGAISIGTDQIGPMMISMKKKPEERHSATTVMSWMKRIGASDNSAPAKPVTTTDSRAKRTLPVRLKIPSERMPPRLSPTTPAKNTPEAKIADFLMSRL